MSEPFDRAFVARAIMSEPGGPILSGHAVVVRGDRVASIRPVAELTGGGEIVDLGESLVMPGLIDTHVHLGFDSSTTPEAPMLSEDTHGLAVHARAQARAFLRSGVTTVRDLGCRGTTITEIAAVPPQIAGLPRILAANEPLGVTGGHCDYMSTACDDLARLCAAIDARAAEKAHTVKIMLTGGFIDDGGEAAHRVVYDVETLRAATAYAHRLDLRVAVHAHNVAGILQCAQAGVDTIEHCSMLGRSGIAADPAVYRELAASGSTAVPTVSALWDVDLPWAPRDEALEAIKSLIAHRVPIAFGSDSGIPGAFPGKPLDGLRVLVRAGMSPADALRAATLRAAEVLGMSHTIGRLLPGHSADMLVLDGDPCADLDVLAAPRRVIVAGQSLWIEGDGANE